MGLPVDWDENLACEIIEAKSGLEGALLPILHELQEKFGYVDPKAVGLIAKTLNLSRAEIFGTISFYHDFKRQKPLGRTIKFCVAEACQARGADSVAQAFEQQSGAKIDGGYHSGVAVVAAYCLGNCALGPNALFDGELFAALDAEGLAALCARAGEQS